MLRRVPVADMTTAIFDPGEHEPLANKSWDEGLDIAQQMGRNERWDRLKYRERIPAFEINDAVYGSGVSMRETRSKLPSELTLLRGSMTDWHENCKSALVNGAPS